MNIEDFRHDLIAAMERQGLNANRMARLAHVQQSSLYNFINKKALLSGEFVLRLMPFVYDGLPLFVGTSAPSTTKEAPHVVA